jgi:excisionase family DNA binding protein
VHGIAEELGVDVQTVRRWIHSGRLRAFKPGKEYRVRESDLEEFLAAREVRPKVQAPREEGQASFNDALADERRAEWDAAVRNARQLREHGRTRMGELLWAWHTSKARSEAKDARRAYLGEMGELLDDAQAAETALLLNLEAGLAAGDREAAERLTAGEKNVLNPGFEEFREASHFYGALRQMVEGAGLSIRPDGAQEENAQAGQPAAHTVAETAAA